MMLRYALVIAMACEATQPPPAITPNPPVAPSAAVAPVAPVLDAGVATDAEHGRVIVTVSDPCGLVMDQLYFAEGSAQLAPAQTPAVDTTADMLRCFAKIGEISRWQVIGNADATERDGERLARDRAQTVIDALVARGVSRNSLDGVGVGATDPADERRTPDARAKNRRVELMPIRQAR